MKHQCSKLGFRHLMKLLFEFHLHLLRHFKYLLFEYCTNDQLWSAILIPVEKFTELTKFGGKAGFLYSVGDFLWKKNPT